MILNMNESKPIVVALGELLWDRFPTGAKFGGAPGNFAHHVAALGAETYMVSAVGDDELGRRAMKRLQQSGIQLSHVVVNPQHPTGSVDVTVDSEGHPSYEFHNNESWDFLEWSDDLAALAHRCDAVCFGTLGQRSEPSRSTIQRFVSSTKRSALRITDINLRVPFYSDQIIQDSLQLVNVLKLNDDELRYLAKMLGLRTTAEAEQANEIRERYELELVAVTRGRNGAMVVTQDSTFDVAGRSTDVSDTVGAGDSFTAALVAGLLQGRPVGGLVETACRIAEYVCSQPGATPQLPEAFRSMFVR